MATFDFKAQDPWLGGASSAFPGVLRDWKTPVFCPKVDYLKQLAAEHRAIVKMDPASFRATVSLMDNGFGRGARF